MNPETTLLTSDPLLHNLPLDSDHTALTPLSQSLLQVLGQRRSNRIFSARAVPMPMLAHLLWAACGVNRQETGQRTAPSAKNWQEIDIYVAQQDGLFLFEPAAGALRQLEQRDVRAATGWQDFVASAPVNLIYVADLAKMDQAQRWEQKFFAALDTGYISQNVYLFCAAQGFPVIFPADTWQLVMPHELAAWARNDKRYWSEYASDGHTRYCKMYAPVRFDERSQRVVRTFGGRPVQLRPENNGVCDPENCPEFQNRQCNLTGKFIFYIPGIASIDAFVLHTNSFYAMSRAIEHFETISFMRGGRLAGFLDQHRTPFYFSKKLRDVSHIDPKTGQSVRSAHWIIELEAPINVSSLLIQHDDESALHLADQAANILQGHHEQRDAASTSRHRAAYPSPVNCRTARSTARD